MIPPLPKNRHNILVLLHYHDDPESLLTSFQSLKFANKHYENWRVAILDTAQNEPAEDVLAEEMKDLPGKTTFYTSKMTDFQSIITGGMLGMYLNRMITDNTDADVITFLENGNVMHPKLLFNLDWFFNYRPKLSCYVHVCPFNDNEPLPDDFGKNPIRDYYLNHYKCEIDPCGVVELGQLAWKSEVHWQFKLWFPWPTLRGPVNDFMKHLYYRTGPTVYAGFVGYYKQERKSEINAVERDVIACKMARANTFIIRGENLQAKYEYEEVLKMDPDSQEARVMKEIASRSLGVKSIVSTGGDCRA